MSAENTIPDAKDPHVFSRGSLKMTYDLIRKSSPQLALKVRNIIGGQALPKDASQQDNKHADFFEVDLDSFEVRAVVEALMAQLQSGATGPQLTGMAVLAKSLIEEWLVLARKMFADLPEDQKPEF